MKQLLRVNPRTLLEVFSGRDHRIEKGSNNQTVLRRAARLSIPVVTPLFLLLGCGDGQEANRADISGKVILNGKPLANVGVHFVLEGGEITSAGVARTSEDGSYKLSHGAAIGLNKVYFSDLSAFDTQRAMASPDWDGQDVVGPAIPKKYTDPTTSLLTFKVAEAGSSDADFNLAGDK